LSNVPYVAPGLFIAVLYAEWLPNSAGSDALKARQILCLTRVSRASSVALTAALPMSRFTIFLLKVSEYGLLTPASRSRP
jgi:hypothetical protein